MSERLKLLQPQYRDHLKIEFYTGDEDAPDLDRYLDSFPGREIELQPLINITEKAIEKFSGRRPESDSWLASRVHATLRLSRRDAGNRRVWSYLAVGPLLKYVRWRWREGEGSGKFPTRFFGPMREQAVARLWWGAELTRNGGSYESATKFFRHTDVPNSWINLIAFRHRPAALAAIRFIYDHEIDGVAVGDRHRQLVRAFNSALSTTVLDAVAPNPPGDPADLEEWINAATIDETLMFDEDPKGPPEPPVPEGHVSAVLELIKRVARNTNFKRRARATKPESVEV